MKRKDTKRYGNCGADAERATQPALEQFLEKVRAADLPQFDGVPLDSIMVRGREPFQESLLHVAAIWGDAGAIEALLDAGVEIDLPGELGCTALHEAARQEHVECVRILLTRGANPTLQCAFGNLNDIAMRRGNESLQLLAASAHPLRE
jgi:ankyrin repeat protein